MADARFYDAIDFGELEFYYGEIETATSSTIRITDGYSTTTYRGDFYYDYDYDYGDVYGDLESIVTDDDGETTAEVTDIDRDVYTFWEYANYGDAQGALAYVFSGEDRIEGSRYSDVLYGFRADDVLVGNGGNDRLYGDSGADRLSGGTSSDTYIVNSSSDRVVEGSRSGTADQVNSSVSHKLAANVEKLSLTGSSSIDGTGNTLDNTVYGNSASNVLKGWSGDDSLKGNAGSDELMGGSGQDRLHGGSGYDTFIFRSASEAGIGSDRDVIRDFDRSDDVIDVSEIDADKGRSGNQDFDYVGRDLFTRTAGELRLDSSGVLRGDTNGDGRTDFQIEVADVRTLGAYDFYL